MSYGPHCASSISPPLFLAPPQAGRQHLLKNFKFYLAVLCNYWTIVPWPGIGPMSPALGAWSLNHWATKEVPGSIFIISLHAKSPGLSPVHPCPFWANSGLWDFSDLPKGICVNFLWFPRTCETNWRTEEPGGRSPPGHRVWHDLATAQQHQKCNKVQNLAEYNRNSCFQARSLKPRRQQGHALSEWRHEESVPFLPPTLWWCWQPLVFFGGRTPVSASVFTRHSAWVSVSFFSFSYTLN